MSLLLPAWTPLTPVLDGWTGRPCGWLAGMTWGGLRGVGVLSNKVKPLFGANEHAGP